MKPVVEIAGARVFLGDCRDVLKSLPDNSVDSVVTDPPYELGFMGKKWDNSGIAYDVTVWLGEGGENNRWGPGEHDVEAVFLIPIDEMRVL